jgi:hypothetical protein
MFENLILTAIFINTLCLCIDHWKIGDQMTAVLSVANLIFVIIFTFEAFLRITAFGWTFYWQINWNKFDFIIALVSLAALNERFFENTLNFNVTALRIIRASRLLKMVKTS